MNTTVVVLKIVGCFFCSVAAVYCGWTAVKLWRWKARETALTLILLAALNIGLLAVNASYFFQHGTADAKAPVPAVGQQPVPQLPGPADLEQAR